MSAMREYGVVQPTESTMTYRGQVSKAEQYRQVCETRRQACPKPLQVIEQGVVVVRFEVTEAGGLLIERGDGYHLGRVSPTTVPMILTFLRDMFEPVQDPMLPELSDEEANRYSGVPWTAVVQRAYRDGAEEYRRRVREGKTE